jgi:nucleoside-diphosphate-sugar epimerase
VKVIVTGGAGFIGSHLCARLLADGHQVTCVDNLITGKTDNIAALHQQPNFDYRQQDVIQPFDAQAEAIFHLASPASPPGYLKNPVETALVNSVGTYNMLELARRNNASFLFASTSEAYGDPHVHPQDEEYWGNVNPNGVRSCYDESKRFGESMTMTFVRQFNLDARIIRIFNSYGPHSDPRDGRIVPNFITQALLGETITVYGDGKQTRSLCFVSDLVEGIVRAMWQPNTQGRVYNLGNPDERTVLEFAEHIKKLTRSNAPIEFRPFISADDPQRRCPVITRARNELGWEPRVPLDEGLAITIQWFREKLGVPLAP